jgi:putative ABC transport system permease protein
MLKNYITVALRHIWKDKFYTFLNIFGLAIGITCFILILLFIRDELSYEKKFSKSERTYRVCEIIASDGGGENSASVPIPLKRVIMNDHPDIVETATRMFNFQSSKFVIEIEDETYIEKKLFFVDSTFFDVFDYKFVKGSPETALSEPFNVVLTVDAAKKYFGDEDPIGKQIRGQGQKQSAVVSAVIDPSGVNSHLDFNVLASIETVLQPWTLQNFYWNPAWTYVVLKEGHEGSELESRFPEMVKKYFPEHIIEGTTLYLMGLEDIHLHSNLDFEMHPNSDITYVYIFAAIAILVLVISCTNFINLATARTANRAKEVGMRKVMGAHKGQLVGQFLGETIFQSFVALLIGIIFAELLLNTFNSFSGKSFTHDFVLDPFMISAFIGIGLITGIVSGIYPAFFLSSFRPSRVLKGGLSLGVKKYGFRQVLVVLQFSISIILIVGTVVAFQQLSYMQKANLGFDKEQIMVVPFNNGLPIGRWDAMHNELVKYPGISNMSASSHVLGSGHQTDSYRLEGTDDNLQIAFLNYSEIFAEVSSCQ